MREFAETLDEDRLRVFILAEFGQLRGREIADELGLNLNTVYARLRSAHKDLDRVTARLRAREARVLLEAARERRPSKATRRRAWAALALKLGLPKVTSGAAAGVAAGAGLSAKWLVGVGLAALGMLGVVAVVTSDDADHPGAADAPARVQPVAAAEPAARDASRSAVEATVTAADPDAPAPTDPAAFSAAVEAVPGQPPATARPRAPKASDAAAASSTSTSTSTSADLAAEVALVKELRRNVGKAAPFAAILASYRRAHADGELRPEVEALEIEHDCRRGQTTDAAASIAAFEARHPGSSLARRLRAACDPKKGPQNPEADRTQGT